ncbi:prohibitin family protein [Pseudoruminococcus massiliensis]|uniref:prohibitin family protein n=1 Tax=Pseudoruminococcus massiliensis TaxID=2086583 RepID=UPI000D0E49BA|nr:prohibitin family protein [Pseudoruminococcus massiliensis]
MAEEGKKVFTVNPNGKKVKIIVGVCVALLLIVAISIASITIVPAGHKGVTLNMGAVTGAVMNEGINFKIPFVQNAEIIDVRVKKYESKDNSSASKDLQTIKSSIAVNYRVNQDHVADLYQKIGMSYESTVINPAISECIKSVTSRYTAEELITKRTEVSEEMKKFLQKKLSEKYILVDSFNIINFDFTDAFNTAIEEKQIAEQNALKAKYDLERIKTEAEQAVTKAKGEAEAMKLKNEQISQSIIYLEFIDKWDGKMPTYYGSDNLFLGLDMNNIQSANTGNSTKSE